MRCLRNFQHFEEQTFRCLEKYTAIFDTATADRKDEEGEVTEAKRVRRGRRMDGLSYCNNYKPDRGFGEDIWACDWDNAAQLREHQIADVDMRLIIDAKAMNKYHPWESVSVGSRSLQNYWKQWDCLFLNIQVPGD